MFCTFSLPNVLFATVACNFAHQHFKKCSETDMFCYTFASKCAFRHSGVQFLMSLLSTYLRARRFNRPTFRLTRHTNHWKNTAFRNFSNIWRGCIFFLLTFALLHLLSADLTACVICFSTVHIVGSFYLNFLRWSFTRTSLWSWWLNYAGKQISEKSGGLVSEYPQHALNSGYQIKPLWLSDLDGIRSWSEGLHLGTLSCRSLTRKPLRPLSTLATRPRDCFCLRDSSLPVEFGHLCKIDRSQGAGSWNRARSVWDPWRYWLRCDCAYSSGWHHAPTSLACAGGQGTFEIWHVVRCRLL